MNRKPMTTLEQIQFCAKVQIGTHIKCGNGYATLIITKITKNGFVAYSKERFEKNGTKKEDFIISYTTIMNPHYNSGYEIISHETDKQTESINHN